MELPTLACGGPRELASGVPEMQQQQKRMAHGWPFPFQNYAQGHGRKLWKYNWGIASTNKEIVFSCAPPVDPQYGKEASAHSV